MFERSGLKASVAAAKSAQEMLRTGTLRCWLRGRQKLQEIKGQGTTEYAILVGVLVVIAIIAVVAFKPKLQELWDAISTNISEL